MDDILLLNYWWSWLIAASWLTITLASPLFLWHLLFVPLLLLFLSIKHLIRIILLFTLIFFTLFPRLLLRLLITLLITFLHAFLIQNFIILTILFSFDHLFIHNNLLSLILYNLITLFFKLIFEKLLIRILSFFNLDDAWLNLL